MKTVSKYQKKLELINKKNTEDSFLYCGIDYHKNTSYIVILNADGQRILEEQVASSRVVSVLENYKNLWIAIEISGGVQHLADILEARGHKISIINAVKFRAIGVGGQKNDRSDAWALAQALRVGYTPEVFKKSPYARQLKLLLTSRSQIVDTRVSLTNHIRGILREYGIKIDQGSAIFWNDVGPSLEGLDFEPQKRIIKSILDTVAQLKAQELAIEEELKKITEHDDRIARLQTIPGVGFLTSVAFVAVIDDVSRFSRVDKIGAYLGLVPSERSSGGKRRLGGITKCGSELLRKYLIQGARVVMQHKVRLDSDRTRKWAQAVSERAGGNKAVVALAHKKAKIMFAMLRDGTTFSKTGHSPKKKIA